MKQFVVDFETYYSKADGIGVTDQGILNYARTQDAYMVSVVGHNSEWVGTIAEARQQFPDSFWADPGNEFWAANANFDETFARKYWPVHPAGWQCLLDLAAGQQLPKSVGDVARVVLNHKVDKSLRAGMNGVRYETLPEDQKKGLVEYCLNDAKIEWELLKKLRPISTTEKRVAAHTRMTNLRGIMVDYDLIQRDRERLLAYRDDYEKRIPWRDDYAMTGRKGLAVWAQAEGVTLPESLAKGDDECLEMASKDPKLAAMLDILRKYKKANSLLEKIRAIVDRTTPDSVMPMELRYCGARHTRRWSSAGVNIQNLDKAPFTLDDTGYSIWPRKWLIARPGKIFLMPDFAQIEPRALAWATRNTELLDLVRKGFVIYEAAARIAGLWSGDVPLKKGNPALYTAMKPREIGLGYRMGAQRYMETAASYGIKMDLEQAEKEKTEWRARNPKIVQFWAQMDRELRTSLMKDRILDIQMPTGDHMKLFHLTSWVKKVLNEDTGKTEMRSSISGASVYGDPYGHDSLRANIHGGTITENICQRLSRDITAEKVLALEDAGLPVVFHSHDEAIMEVDMGRQAEAEAAATEIMTTSPAWCPDLPIGIDCKFSPHYTK
mgnify:CR=1 FL=1